MQIQVREIIASSTPKGVVKAAIDRIGVRVTCVKATTFEQPEIDEMSRVFAKGSQNIDGIFSKCVMAAVRYLNLMTGKLHLKSSELDMSRFARLDSGIFANLHLDNSSQNEDSLAKTLSVGCSTAQGVRMIRKFVTQPLLNREEILERQNMVQFLIDNSDIRVMLADSQLKRLPDISKCM